MQYSSHLPLMPSIRALFVRCMAAACMLVASAVPYSAIAAETAPGTFKVNSLETAVGGWTWVYLNRNHNMTALCGSNRNSVILSGPNNTVTENGHRNNMQVLSLALVSGKDVILRLERVAGENYCYIERTTILR